MNNRWTEDLRSRMSDYEVDAPEHLFDDIMGAIEAAEKLGVRTDVGQVFTSDQFYNANPDAGRIHSNRKRKR